MLPEKASSQINVLPSTRSQIQTFTEKFIKEMESGIVESTKVALQLKAMEELIKTLRSNKTIRELIMDEVDKHPEKSFVVEGAKFEKAETGVKYDYSNTGSTKLNNLYKQRDEINGQIKALEELLQALGKSDQEVYDEASGELLQPPVRKSNSYIKITLAK